MDNTAHRFSDLFAQLGLPSDDASIEGFIRTNSPLDAEVELADAPFWSEAQTAFLREEWREDADWAVLVDQLNLALRAPIES